MIRNTKFQIFIVPSAVSLAKSLCLLLVSTAEIDVIGSIL